MKTLALEIRDRATFLPMLAVQMTSSNMEQKYLLRRSGYGGEHTLIMLWSMSQSRTPASYDPHDWNDRTRRIAHQYIQENFNELSDGDVIDVEFILGETTSPKISERFNDSSYA